MRNNVVPERTAALNATRELNPYELSICVVNVND